MLPEIPSHSRRHTLDEEVVRDRHRHTAEEDKLGCYPALMHLAYAKPDPLFTNPSIIIRNAMEPGDP